MQDNARRPFEEAWNIASLVPGWLTADQAELLYLEARKLAPGATVVEIGSHQGRSTIVLGVAMQGSGHVIAIDPFVDGRLFGGLATREKFASNIAGANLSPTVELLQDFSTAARPSWQRRFDYLYIDGKHDYWSLSDDLRWALHLPEGAPILIHDCFSSIGVTLGILRHVLPTSTMRYEQRVGSMALFRKGRPSLADRARIVRELPWWIRNVGIKILLRLRLRFVARMFGHSGAYDPY